MTRWTVPGAEGATWRDLVAEGFGIVHWWVSRVSFQRQSFWVFQERRYKKQHDGINEPVYRSKDVKENDVPKGQGSKPGLALDSLSRVVRSELDS